MKKISLGYCQKILDEAEKNGEVSIDPKILPDFKLYTAAAHKKEMNRRREERLENQGLAGIISIENDFAIGQWEPPFYLTDTVDMNTLNVVEAEDLQDLLQNVYPDPEAYPDYDENEDVIRE